jgi:hypothetical protein
MIFEPEGEAQILRGSTRKGIAASSQQVAKPLGAEIVKLWGNCVKGN